MNVTKKLMQSTSLSGLHCKSYRNSLLQLEIYILNYTHQHFFWFKFENKHSTVVQQNIGQQKSYVVVEFYRSNSLKINIF